MTAVAAPGIPRTRHAGLGRTEIRLGHTDPGGRYVEITAAMPLMATSAFLDPLRARALAADLKARAVALDPPPALTHAEVIESIRLCGVVVQADESCAIGNALGQLRALLDRFPVAAPAGAA